MITDLLTLAQIKVDHKLQPRTGIRKDTVADFVDSMVAGDIFPPLTVWLIDDQYYLVDGFHRYYAIVQLGHTEARCTIEEGTLEQAFQHAINVNRLHGLRFSNADKRKIVKWMFEHYPLLSDRDIAKKAGVSQPFVSGLRAELLEGKSQKRKEKPKEGANKSRDVEAENKRLRRQVEKLKAELASLRDEKTKLWIELRKCQQQKGETE